MKLEKVKVNEKDGYTIFYNPERKLFCLEDAEGNEVATAGTQEKVEAEIPKIIKQVFKLPIPAILNRFSYVERGRITSLNMQHETVYFSYDDKGMGSTQKIALRYDRGLYELTEANEQIIKRMEENLARKKELDKENETLKEKLEKPINAQYFGV